MHHMHRQRSWFEFAEDRLESAVAQMVSDLIRQQTGQTKATRHCSHGGVVGGGCQARLQLDRARRALVNHAPFSCGCHRVGRDNAVCLQVSEYQRDAVLLQISGRGADHSAHLTHTNGLHRRVRQFADAHCNVDAFVQQVDHTVQKQA